MTRQWGWAPKGERIAEATPQGRWKVLTTLGAMTIESATDGDVFTVYVEQVLCAALRPGDVVVMDSLSAHKVAGIPELIESSGARVLWCLLSIVSDITIIYFLGEAVAVIRLTTEEEKVLKQYLLRNKCAEPSTTSWPLAIQPTHPSSGQKPPYTRLLPNVLTPIYAVGTG